MTVMSFVLSGSWAVAFVVILYFLVAVPVLLLAAWLLDKARDWLVRRIHADAESKRAEILQDE